MVANIENMERYDISDCFAYLYQYERDIIHHDIKDMQNFCADIALKRLFLYDKFIECFENKTKREEIIAEINNHIENGRCTENTIKSLKKYLKK